MRIVISIISILFFFGLTGCASLTNDYPKYAETIKAHSEAESSRIADQAQAIVDAAQVEQATKTESVLLAVIAQMQISSLNPTKLDIKAPITGYQVLNTAVGHLPLMTTTLGMYKIAERGFEAAGNVVMNADNIENSDSFNATEVHATGDSNNASAPENRTVKIIEPEPKE